MKFKIESDNGSETYHRSEMAARSELKRRGRYHFSQLYIQHRDGGKLNRQMEWEPVASEHPVNEA